MKKKFCLVLIALSLAFIFSSCSTDDDDSETTYTVWTDFGTYAEFQSSFNQTLEDNHYSSWELTNQQFKQLSSYLTDEYKHNWTKSQIKDWLIGRGFDNSVSTENVAWITTSDHCMLATRSGNLVYFILK